MTIIRPTEKVGTVRGTMAVVVCGGCKQVAWANFRRTTVGKPQEVRTVCCGHVSTLKSSSKADETE